MYQSLLNYISKYSGSSISLDEEEMIKRVFQPKKLKKRQFFLQEGELSRYTGFITKGAMRQYLIDEKKGEQIVNLFVENYWATDRESFFNLTPSKYYIDAWEETELLVVNSTDFAGLMAKIPAIVEMLRVMDDRNAIAMQKRLDATIFNTAEERYNDFLNHYPQFSQRFPQHQIASFIGITQETLSRVRRKSTK
ncbi:Crp/Fnr family transcriptional regulator [Algoriphagus sp. AGSA1]|uniref:Crp/Fnr family transcriptional regulator n=1 Tax=Algoriphagus sp. AGSA1 TaxID=2907213 RepID=UPI001F3943F1|nr:Crp/Fnr family transcriptional regulator [Algoriphagus sp. AGSA1]MCE7054176.1 Crp/Fnr family transcriptional regulator [Algoriphagus sp. AGSA1]